MQLNNQTFDLDDISLPEKRERGKNKTKSLKRQKIRMERRMRRNARRKQKAAEAQNDPRPNGVRQHYPESIYIEEYPEDKQDKKRLGL